MMEDRKSFVESEQSVLSLHHCSYNWMKYSTHRKRNPQVKKKPHVHIIYYNEKIVRIMKIHAYIDYINMYLYSPCIFIVKAYAKMYPNNTCTVIESSNQTLIWRRRILQNNTFLVNYGKQMISVISETLNWWLTHLFTII